MGGGLSARRSLAHVCGCSGSTLDQGHTESFRSSWAREMICLDHPNQQLPAGPTFKAAGDLSKAALRGFSFKRCHQCCGDSSLQYLCQHRRTAPLSRRALVLCVLQGLAVKSQREMQEQWQCAAKGSLGCMALEDASLAPTSTHPGTSGHLPSSTSRLSAYARVHSSMDDSWRWRYRKARHRLLFSRTPAGIQHSKTMH